MTVNNTTFVMGEKLVVDLDINPDKDGSEVLANEDFDIYFTAKTGTEDVSGLDLGVIDHYNGTRRSVKTFSGGESFKASLALALGLSDEVQSTAGGIRLDTLFLDEGFGSLDDESLEQAIRVLSGLTEGDRLVGIISHVAALKDRIDHQVLVKKARSGGSTVELIV